SPSRCSTAAACAWRTIVAIGTTVASEARNVRRERVGMHQHASAVGRALVSWATGDGRRATDDGRRATDDGRRTTKPIVSPSEVRDLHCSFVSRRTPLAARYRMMCPNRVHRMSVMNGSGRSLIWPLHCESSSPGPGVYE